MNQFSTAAPLRRRFSGTPNLLSSLALVLLLALSLRSSRAEDPDARYLLVFDIIQQGDVLKKNGQTDAAMAKYHQAQTNLMAFQRAYPDKDTKVVSYRLNYVTAQIAALSPKSSTGAPESSSGGTAAAGGSTQVKLLEPGAEPRKALRFHPKPGDKQSMLMTMKIGMDIKMGEMENPPVKLPVMKLAMDVTVKDVASNGDISYDIVTTDASVVDDPDVIPQVADAMKNALAGIKGLGGKGVVSSRGISKGAEVKAPEGADPQVSQFVDQIRETISRVVTPLPEEPVGAGAKWEARMPIKSQGITLNQKETSELASIDGDHGSVKTSVSQTASNQKIQNPMMPGTKVDLAKMSGNGTGEVTFDLGRILPPEASGQFHQEMSMSVAASNGGQKQNLAMKLDLELHIESK